MSDSFSDRNPLDALAEEFAARYRRGERPPLSEYIHKHPQWADDIRALFPALVMMEQFKPGPSEMTGPGRGPPAAGPASEWLGQYRILREVGRGGMGVVYEAEQASLGRRVALKVLPPALLDGDRLQRFQREARSVAGLHHTNIVPVYGVGEREGTHYFVMQFIQGQPLDQVLDELRRASGGRQPPEGAARSLLTDRFALSQLQVGRDTDGGRTTAVFPSSPTEPDAWSGMGQPYWRSLARIGVQVAEALDYAHGQGVLHRDVKPSNLLLDSQGTVWVTDFGLAKATDSGDLTGTGEVVGTLRYIPPERFVGRSDARGDVYSLGLTLYELMTLQPAFDGEERVRLMEQILHAEPPPPRSSQPNIPRDLETVVLKAIDRDPARRYQTASDLADDLRRFLDDQPIQARRVGAIERTWRWCRRNPVVAGLTGTVAALLVCLAVGGLVMSLNLWAALDQAREADRDKTDKLWLSHYERARAGRFSRQMGQRLESLAALADAARIRPDERLRDEAIAALALNDVRRGPSWVASPPGTKAIAFDGSYRHYARFDDQGTISVRTIPDDREIQRFSSNPTLVSGCFWLSPDGRFVAKLESGATLQVWRVEDGNPLLSKPPMWCWGPTFSPDGRHLAVGTQGGWIIRFDLETGQEASRWRLPARPHSLAFHPDNRRMAVGYDRSREVSVYDAVAGTLLTELNVVPFDKQVVAWHPDGSRLAIAGSKPRIQIWDVPTKRPLAALEGFIPYVTVLSFHPEGDLLLSAGWEGGLRLWHVSSGRQLMQLTHHASSQFSLDGRWLGVARHGEEAQLLEVVPTHEYRTLVSSEGAGRGAYNYGDISSDGRLLALGMDSGTHVWDLASGQEAAHLPGLTRRAFFDRQGPSYGLLTSDVTGLHRWPLRDDGRGLRIGPPRQLSYRPRADFARSPQGHTLAVVYTASANIEVLDLEREAVQQGLGSHSDGDGPYALSPDGRWLASCGWHSEQVRLWDVSTRKLVQQWDFGVHSAVFFTPDSRALIVSRGDEFTFWDVQSLQLLKRLRRDVALFPGFVAFSPDGQLMAMEMAPAVVHLKEATTGRTVAKLEDPQGDRASWIGFTPDGTQLVVVASYAHAIHVWDLQAIRRQLKAINLDWNWPEFPPAAEPASAPLPLTVTVDAGHMQHQLDYPDAREAVDLLSVSLALEPWNPQAYLDRAQAFLRLRQLRPAAVDGNAFLLLAPLNHPDRMLGLYRRAAAAAEREDYFGALKDLLLLAQSDLTNFPQTHELADHFNNAAWHLLTAAE